MESMYKSIKILAMQTAYSFQSKDQARFAAAHLIASAVHQNEVRKFSNCPYIVHPMQVSALAGIMSDGNTDALCIGILHDTIETCRKEHPEYLELLQEAIAKQCGQQVLDSVIMLTPPPKDAGSREKRHLMEQVAATRYLPIETIVKVADIRSNTSEFHRMYEAGTAFALKYLNEKISIANRLDGSSPHVLQLRADLQALRNRYGSGAE